MKKAWTDIKSFVTVAMTVAYIVLTFLGKMTPEFQNLYAIIIAFYFGTQAEKLANKMFNKIEEKPIEEVKEGE